MRAPLGALLLTGLSGCAWLRPELETPRERELPGVIALAYDGLDVLVTQDPQGAGQGLRLYAHGAAIASAALRVGDRFTLTDGERVSDNYQVLAASSAIVTLKRERVERLAAGESGFRRSARVMGVEPYDLRSSSESP